MSGYELKLIWSCICPNCGKELHEARFISPFIANVGCSNFVIQNVYHYHDTHCIYGDAIAKNGKFVEIINIRTEESKEGKKILWEDNWKTIWDDDKRLSFSKSFK